MLTVDLYKQPFQLLLPDGKYEYRTFTGAILTIFTFMIMISYSLFKLTMMVTREDNKVRQMDLAGYYEDTDEFNESHGFDIAAGIIAWETLPTSYENWR